MGNKKEYGLLRLFFDMLVISSCTFGGGFVIVSVMKKKYVDTLGILTEQEMLDYISIAQSSPGAIAVNAAILVGKRLCGVAGVAVAVLGTIIPPMTILSVISLFYNEFAKNIYVAYALKGMQAGVAAVIVDVALTLGVGVAKERNAVHIMIMCLAFGLAFFTNVNVALIIFAAAAIGVLCALLHEPWVKWREGRRHR